MEWRSAVVRRRGGMGMGFHSQAEAGSMIQERGLVSGKSGCEGGGSWMMARVWGVVFGLVLCGSCGLGSGILRGADEPLARDVRGLAELVRPWLEMATERMPQYRLQVEVSPTLEGREQRIGLEFVRYDDESFDFRVDHPDYGVSLRRRGEGLAMAIPKHGVVFVGTGEVDPKDHLRSKDFLKRLMGAGTQVASVYQIVRHANAEDLAAMAMGLAKIRYTEEEKTWRIDEAATIEIVGAQRWKGKVYGVPFEAQWERLVSAAKGLEDWGSYRVERLNRREMEWQLMRGARRAVEVLAPSQVLQSPSQVAKRVPHGELRWVEGQRVVLLEGTPEEVGRAHGELLKEESLRCIDSVLNAFGTFQTVANGRWFRHDLDRAYARLLPYLPEDHKRETLALAEALGLEAGLVQAVNIFPELFHCSGFAVYGKATRDGKLYHGRVLDYMTTIGLQDSATNFVVQIPGKIPFANVGYAGFIGSVSGMNAEQISLGEMGGRGEGAWDGVPMATLMRRALEECRSLEEVKGLWSRSARTCEYYYVFADGKTRTAVGCAATPTSLEFIGAGETHPLLGAGIEDAVVLSAGERLALLRERVVQQHGKLDAEGGMRLMDRPVAMQSNLHNVLFVPEDGVLYVANADHGHPAAERPYVRLDLRSMVEELRSRSKERGRDGVGMVIPSSWESEDTLSPKREGEDDAAACLRGLVWEPGRFRVSVRESQGGKGPCLVQYPSPLPVGDATNDQVTMEWYQVKGKEGEVVRAPAAVVVHESGRGMTVGRMIAQALSRKGVHAFMVQLPFYGERRTGQERPGGEQVVAALRQGIADVRRAKDAIRGLACVDAERISLQGTSLGGFVVATTAGIDEAYHRVFVLLAGGGLYDVLNSGKKDAAKMREEFEKAGVDAATMKSMLESIEPLRLAHRIQPERTWLYSGKFDDVVPPAASMRWAEAARLPEGHHIEMVADHYSGIILLPTILQEMVGHMCETESGKSR